MEACGSAHYWAHRFREAGHEMRLIAPQFVKPFVKSNKNDAADAEAICEPDPCDRGAKLPSFFPVRPYRLAYHWNGPMQTERDASIDTATAEALRLFAERITAKYDVLDLMLFGSRARGDHGRDSDADVAVLRRGDHQRLLPTQLAMADEAFDVLLETGVRIQPLPIWEDEWANPDHSANPRLLKNIAREGLRL